MALFEGQSTRDLLREIAPETASASDELLDTFITIATARNSPSVFGSLYRIAVAYFAAHLFVVSQRRGGFAGPVIGRRAGEVSENYGNVNNAVQYNDTSYGRLYRDLLDSRPASKPTSSSPLALPSGNNVR